MDILDSGSPLPKEKEDEGYAPRLNEMSQKFIADCLEEKERLSDDFPLAAFLINEAIDRVQTTGRIPGREMHADVYKQKPMKVTQKVFVPIKQYPKFNFNGKILGPKGNSLRRLQEETMCRIGIKGRNSMRDSEKEEELRQSGDPRHAHLHKDLYVEISTVAIPAEAYARMAYALAEIRKYLVPDKNDEVSQGQLKEILADPESAQKAAKFAARLSGRPVFKGQHDHNKGGVSILHKITGRAFDEPTRNHEEDEQEEYEYEPKNPSYKSYQPMRQTSQSQRQPMKRPQQQQSSQPQTRYQNPQKRSRETSMGGNNGKASPFAFFQKYQ